MKIATTLRTIAPAVVLLGLGCAPVTPLGAAEYPDAAVMYATFGPNHSQLFIADGDGQHVRPLLSRPVFDYNASLSVDGRWVTFTSERDGSPDVYRVHPDGTGLERLTEDPAYDDRGVLSPDGRWLAFVSTRETGNANIWLLDLETRSLKNLTRGSIGDFRPAWSPDGDLIAFSSVRDAVPMKPGADVAVDPKSYTVDVYLMRRDGTGLRRLTTSGAILNPAWSADGTKLAAVRRAPPEANADGTQQPNAIVSIDVADGAMSVLREVPAQAPPNLPQWISPSRVAYVTSYSFGFTDGDVDYSDGTAGPRGEFGGARWSTDGGVMVFHRLSDVSSRPGAPASPLPAAMRSVLASMSPYESPITFKPQPTLDPGFRVMRTGLWPASVRTGDRSGIVMSDPSGSAANAIVAVSPGGSGRRVIFGDPTRSAEMLAGSPRGDEIAFALSKLPSGPLQPREPTHLALIHADGTALRELPDAGDGVGFPSWSPDGASIVYSVMADGRRSGSSGLRIIDLHSGRVTTVTTDLDSFPSWSPLGDRIAFTRSPRSIAGAAQIYTIKPDGSELTRLTLSPGAQDAHPAWSPDGRWIAFASSRPHPRDENLIPMAHHAAGGQIFVMRADGTDVRQLTDTPAPKALPAWLEVP